MKITEFMKLNNEDKEKYFVSTPEGYEGDVRVFSAAEVKDFGMSCDVCSIDGVELIGSSDIREPKFCFVHFADINKDSFFSTELGVRT